jgi:hypothetical protein
VFLPLLERGLRLHFESDMNMRLLCPLDKSE